MTVPNKLIQGQMILHLLCVFLFVRTNYALRDIIIITLIELYKYTTINTDYLTLFISAINIALTKPEQSYLYVGLILYYLLSQKE